jgi:hypothetical protein
MKYLRLVIDIPRALFALARAFFTGDFNEDGERDDWTR